MISLIIADDHTIVRDGIRLLLEKHPEIHVIGEASTGREALTSCSDLNPDLILLDLDMPDMDGLEVINQLCLLPDPPVIFVLTMYNHEEYAIRAIKAGATGFAVKGISHKELPDAILKASKGEIYVTPALMEKAFLRLQKMAEKTPLSMLSDREYQILVRLASGTSVQEIADELCLSQSSIRTYKQRIFEKLGLKSLPDLTKFAINHKIISDF